jgi:hypothetical protein
MNIDEATDAIFEEAIKQGCPLHRDACENIAKRLLVSRHIPVLPPRDRIEYDVHDSFTFDCAGRKWIDEEL